MACPYFFPTERHAAELWPHRHRLPLGDGWAGRCSITESTCTDDEVRDFCNLGYARNCPHLPPDRSADAVRFGVRAASRSLTVQYVCEREHAPAESGTLSFDPAAGVWTISHPNPMIQRMAECVIASRKTHSRENTDH
jgi:hypothetical protein